MATEITFQSEKFDLTQEDPNPINPIAGQSFLNWLREKLGALGYPTDEPDTEDWGWYVELSAFDSTYLIGASGHPEEGTASVEWHIQIHKRRSFVARLTGANKLAEGDPLSSMIEELVRNEPGFTKVEVYHAG